jgi:arylsulfatase A-like enzyme
MLAFAALAGCGAPEPLSTSVLLVTVDTLRPDYLGANGYDRPTSPFVDSLIAEGTYFEQAVAPVPRTTPALASLLTGAYPHTTRVRTLSDDLSQEMVSLAEILRGWGYKTLAVVSNHVLVRERGLNRGFDEYDMASDARIARATTRAALAALERIDPEKPLFAWVHYIDPHVPYQPDPAVADAFDPDYQGPYRFRFGDMVPPRPSFPAGFSKAEITHDNPLSEQVNEHVHRLYAAEVGTLDPQVEKLVAGMREHTDGDLIVVFTADHGESLGEHGFHWDHGDYVYNAGSRVPLAIVLPASHSKSRAGRCKGWVSLVDVMPTLVELLNREIPAAAREQVEGRSLASCMGGGEVPPAPVYVESGRAYFPEAVPRRVRADVSGRFRAVVSDDWKLIWTPFQSEALSWELYHVREDPDETRDLYSPEHPEVPRLKALLEDWLARQDPEEVAAERELSPDDRERLRSLGYIE